jgi:hypothetical protein
LDPSFGVVGGWVGGKGTSDVLRVHSESVQEVEFVKCPKDVWINVFSVNYRVIVGSHVGSDVDLTLFANGGIDRCFHPMKVRYVPCRVRVGKLSRKGASSCWKQQSLGRHFNNYFEVLEEFNLIVNGR